MDIVNEHASDEFEVFFENVHFVVDLNFLIVKAVVYLGSLLTHTRLCIIDQRVLLLLVEGKEHFKDLVNLTFAS